jgi:hypothetical protein
MPSRAPERQARARASRIVAATLAITAVVLVPNARASVMQPAAPSVAPGAPMPAGATRVIRETQITPPPGPARLSDRAFEPIVATHPSDPNRIAVAYQRFSASGTCGLDPGLRISHDGGRTWREATGRPWRGSGRGPNFHSAIAWGPGPHAGSARLYWADTTVPGCDYSRHQLSVAWSDDEGATWSTLYIARGTPPWVGGFPDITVDRNPASPNYGVVYVAYNWLADAQRGPGLRLLASADFGRTWRTVDVPVARAPKGFGDAWRIAYRVRTGPGGEVYVSSYEADLRVWNSNRIFSKGGAGNVGRLGFTVTRVEFDRKSGRFTRHPTIMAATLPLNAYTISGLAAPGTPGNILVDPAWSHGLDVDPVTGRVFLAVAEYRGRSTSTAPRGTIRVGRSDDRGETWTWATVPPLPAVGGRAQSSFKPNLVAIDGRVFVGFHSLSDVPNGGASSTIGTAYAISVDGGATFSTPQRISAVRWNSRALAGPTNGPGLRERAERTADGNVFYVYGDGRLAAPAPSRRAGRSAVFGAIISIAPARLASIPLRRVA